MEIDMIDNSSSEGDCVYVVEPWLYMEEGDVPCEEQDADHWALFESPKDTAECRVWVADFARKDDALVFKGIMEMGGGT